jgi:hypothetical protein
MDAVYLSPLSVNGELADEALDEECREMAGHWRGRASY